MNGIVASRQLAEGPRAQSSGGVLTAASAAASAIVSTAATISIGR